MNGGFVHRIFILAALTTTLCLGGGSAKGAPAPDTAIAAAASGSTSAGAPSPQPSWEDHLKFLQLEDKYIAEICMPYAVDGIPPDEVEGFPCSLALIDYNEHLAEFNELVAAQQELDAAAAADDADAQNKGASESVENASSKVAPNAISPTNGLNPSGTRCRESSGTALEACHAPVMPEVPPGFAEAAGTVREPSCSEEESKLTFSECSWDIAKNLGRSALGMMTGGVLAVAEVVDDRLSPAPGPNCFSEIIRGVWVSIRENVTVIWDLATMFFQKTKKLEDATSDAALMGRQQSESMIDMFKKDPGKFFVNLGHRIVQLISDGIRDNFMCEGWEWVLKPGQTLPEHVCVKPLKDWACANCNQYVNAFCGVAGYLTGEIVTALLGGGAFNIAKSSVKGLASVHAKLALTFPRLAAAEAKVATVAKAVKVWTGVVGARVAALMAKLDTKVAAKLEQLSKGAAKLGKGVAKLGKPFIEAAQALSKTQVAQAAAKLAKKTAGLSKQALEAMHKAAEAAVRSRLTRMLKATGVATGDAFYAVSYPVRKYFELMGRAFEYGYHGGKAFRLMEAARKAHLEEVAKLEEKLATKLTRAQRDALEEVVAGKRDHLTPFEVRRRERALEKAGFKPAEIEEIRASGAIPKAQVQLSANTPGEVVFQDARLVEIDKAKVRAITKGEQHRYVVDQNDRVFLVEGNIEIGPKKLAVIRNTAGKADDAEIIVKESGVIEFDGKVKEFEMKPDYGMDLTPEEAARIAKNSGGPAEDAVRVRRPAITRAKMMDCLDIVAAQKNGKSFLLDRLVGDNVVMTGVLIGSEAAGAGRFSSETGRRIVAGDYIGTNVGSAVGGFVSRNVIVGNVGPVTNLLASSTTSLGLIRVQRGIHETLIGPQQEGFADDIAAYNIGYFVAKMPINNFTDNFFLKGLPDALFEACASGSPLKIFVSPGMLRIVERGVSNILYFAPRAAILGK